MLKTLRLVETESEVTVSLDVSGRNINIEMSHLDKIAAISTTAYLT